MTNITNTTIKKIVGREATGTCEDLVKSHPMNADRSEVEELKDRLKIMEATIRNMEATICNLQTENEVLKRPRENPKPPQQLTLGRLEDQPRIEDHYRGQISHPFDLYPNIGTDKATKITWPKEVTADGFYSQRNAQKLAEENAHLMECLTKANKDLNGSESHRGTERTNYFLMARKLARIGVAEVTQPQHPFKGKICSVTNVSERPSHIGYCSVVPQSATTG